MAYRLRKVHVPVLPKDLTPVRILHISDTHLSSRSSRVVTELRGLAETKPDLVIVTGDFLGHESAADIALFALEMLLDIPGLFVFGSNDYFGPRVKNPFAYLNKASKVRKLGKEIDIESLNKELVHRGWINLTAKKVLIEIKGVSIEARGTDDAHLDLDNYSEVSGAPSAESDISIGVTHAPYQRILNGMTEDLVDLVFAGHTHGGQIRFPWFGGTRSIITNCDLPNRQSRGLSKIGSKSFLHVSAGLGQSIYAPIRILCPREVSLVTLISKN